ncbi:pyridoxal kinase PdxY [Pararhizobium haloflavum]|uniref:pyridoxal kinase PdxY n=1 Tax=Pararhizobium haloflavum TaxID=2037914 RepID=UPI000C1A4F26|nr:pyridoxal kinase PdxY [Pararhizobium haloflavum]
MSETAADKQAVLVISSHVVRGSVGNRAAVLALELLGHPVWALPTVILPWHPGHGPSTRMALDAGTFGAMIDDLCGAPWLGEIGAVLSGYLGDPGQAAAVARAVSAVRKHNPRAIYMCDPVIGDLGGLYVPKATAAAIQEHLLPIASVATPNRYELAWMSGASLDDNNAIMDAALWLGPERVLVTSAVPMMSGGIGNLLLTARQALLAEHRAISNPPNGLGDLLAAVFLARLMSGQSDEKALQSATATVYEILARTVKRGADELTLESDTESVLRPMAMVQMRHLVHPGQRRRK